MSVRRRIWEIVEAAQPGDTWSRVADMFLLALIFANAFAVVFSSVETFRVSYGKWLNLFEWVSILAFSLEYLVRLWASTADERYGHWFWGRVKFVFHPLSVIDLMAILPFYVMTSGWDLRALRVVYLMRLFRLLKLTRYSKSVQLFLRILYSKKEELLVTMSFMLLSLVISSSLIFYCEHDVQPKAFPDIPSSMWWSVVTLTTVGYGDAYPITPLGKLVASLIAVLGIAMFALPTGILGAAFVEEMNQKHSEGSRCPHCHELLNQPPQDRK